MVAFLIRFFMLVLSLLHFNMGGKTFQMEGIILTTLGMQLTCQWETILELFIKQIISII